MNLSGGKRRGAELAAIALDALRARVRRQLATRLTTTLASDLEETFTSLHSRCASETLTSPERMYGLWQAVGYVEALGVPGDIVECGVWRGGSSMLAALTLLGAGQRDRGLHLYDTFAGMTEPSERDVAFDGYDPQANWRELKDDKESDVLAYADLDTVKANLASTAYPANRIKFVRGRVEDTIPETMPEKIAILRLDTDWYDSTLHELVHLYPRLQRGGVLIVDDYGHWRGARDAVDEYFTANPPRPLLQRLDYTGRMGLRP
jgi:O-methyltransferase